jgi:hypothetical protein
MESSRGKAKEALLEAIAQLEAVAPTCDINAPITLQAITPYMHEFQSTLGREVRSGFRGLLI